MKSFVQSLAPLLMVLLVLHASKVASSPEEISGTTLDVRGQADIILNLISSGEIAQAENLIVDLLLSRDTNTLTQIFTNSFTNHSLSENLSEIVVSIYSKNERPMEVIFGISIVYENVEDQDQTGLVTFLEKVISKIGTSRIGLQGLGQVVDFTYTVQTGAIRVAFSEALSLVQDKKSCLFLAPIIIQAKNSAGPMEKFFTQQLLQEDPKILECFEIEEQIKNGEEFLRNLDVSDDNLESESEKFTQFLQNQQNGTIYEILIGAIQKNQELDLIELFLNIFTLDEDFAQNFVSPLSSIFQVVNENQSDQIQQILEDLFLRAENSSVNLTTQNQIDGFIISGLNLNSTRQNFISALEKTVINDTCEIPNLFQEIQQQLEKINNNYSFISNLLKNNTILNACIQQNVDEKIAPQLEISSPIAENSSLMQKTLENIPPLQKQLVESVPPLSENIENVRYAAPTMENMQQDVTQNIDESEVLQNEPEVVLQSPPEYSGRKEKKKKKVKMK
eukprot:TRINITY_DN412_c1_g2_i3.p1 TRINITY_DN412_c1_g2~~TRINITY_DN412_c1_g2_i3.p1  ORF type:complete len:506 (-),score=66.38 TRINITY_DN412_c1_g2_i3:50-1567(-)